MEIGKGMHPDADARAIAAMRAAGARLCED